MIDLGTVRPGSTIYIPWATFAGATGAPAAMTNLAVGDIKIYKDGSVTERASTAGFTLLDTDGQDFDALTGINGISINLADNTTAGFYASGSRYFIVISDVTIDSQTVRFVLATFDIGLPDAVLNTTVNTLSSQTSFTLLNGPAEDDALNGCVLYIHDVASAVQGGFAVVSDYTGSTKTVTLLAGTTFTVAASDNVHVFPPANVQFWLGTLVASPTVAGVPEVDITHFNGIAGTFSGGRPEVNTSHAAGTAWNSGAIGASTLANDTITAAKVAADVSAEIADAVLDEDMTAHQTQGTLGQAIGDPVADTNSIYKAVVTDAAGATVGVDVVAVKAETASIQADTDDLQVQIGVDGAGLTNMPWNAAWDAEVQSEVSDALIAANLDKLVILSGTADSGSTTTMVDAARTEADADYWKGKVILFTSGSISGQARIITDFNAGSDTITFAPATTQAVGTNTYVILPFVSVWDDVLAEHLGSGSTGAALNAAGAAGDPWSTALPGAYGAGTAGKIVGDNINATISSRATQTSVDTIDDFLDTEIASIQADTDDIQSRLPAALVSGRIDASVGAMAANVVTASAIAADAIGASELAADAVTEIQAGLSTLTQANIRTAVGLASANLDAQLDALPTAADNADAVWDEATSGHTTAGTTGKALTDAGAAGDPWATAVPGAYGVGTAGKILGDNLNATVSSRATQASVDVVDTNVDSILADTGTDGVVVASLANNSITAAALAADAGNEIADAVLKRDWTSVTGEAARSVLNALRFLRNKWSVSAGTLTVTKEDDATTAFTAALSSDAAADPVIGSDPS